MPIPGNISQINAGTDGTENLAPLPDNISQIDSGVDLTDFTIAPDSPITKPLVAMPAELIGTWAYEDDYYQTVIEINANGSIYTRYTYKSENIPFEAWGHLSQLVQEDANLYRLPREQGGGLVPITGLGGIGKNALGIKIDSPDHINIYNWQMPLSQDMETYDYVNNATFIWPLVRVN